MTENPGTKKMTESVERLSLLQKRNNYNITDSVKSSYKMTPELSQALGLDAMQAKKASLRQINIDMESLKRYSKKNSILLQSLTNVNVDDLQSSIGSISQESSQFESSKLALVLKKIKNNK